MSTTTAILVTSLLSYLIGSIPFGLIIPRLVAGIDIRRVGSGNIGATNVARTMGARWGILVLVLDVLKGLLPVALLAPACVSANDTSALMHAYVANGVAAILGHMFPCWLRFRGGKGVATSLGVIFLLGWQSALAAFLVFAVVFAVSRIVSLSSILASITFAVCEFALPGNAAFTRERWSLAVFSLFVPLLIIVKHRGNIARLMRGEESRFRFKRKVDPGEAQ